MAKLSEIYHVNANTRGKAAAGFIRPTLAEGFMSNKRYVEVPLYTDDLCTNTAYAFSNGSTGGATPDRAFNNSVSDYLNDAWYYEATPGIVGYDFQSSNEQIINRYTLTARNAGHEPKSWVFEGSNDSTDGIDGTWVPLDTKTDETAFGASEKRTYDIDNAIAYRFYRFNISAAQSGGTLEIGEIEMMHKNT